MPVPLVLAHRGATRRASENTLEAFSAALALGADGVELDVRTSADGVLVVHHDRMAEGVGSLGRRPFAAIRSARPDIPTLAEALDVCAGALVNVEVKAPPSRAGARRIATLLVELLAARSGRDAVVVSSFEIAFVDRVRRLDSRLDTAVLTSRFTDPLPALELVAQRSHSGLHPSVRTVRTNRGDVLMRRARRLGVAVRPWTVNDAETVAAMATLGVDAVVTDAPEVALSALGRARSV